MLCGAVLAALFLATAFAASLAALLLTGGAVVATAMGHGPFFQGQVAHSLALLWGYACTLAVEPVWPLSPRPGAWPTSAGSADGTVDYAKSELPSDGLATVDPTERYVITNLRSGTGLTAIEAFLRDGVPSITPEGGCVSVTARLAGDHGHRAQVFRSHEAFLRHMLARRCPARPTPPCESAARPGTGRVSPIRGQKSSCAVILANRAVRMPVGVSQAPPAMNAWLYDSMGLAFKAL